MVRKTMRSMCPGLLVLSTFNAVVLNCNALGYKRKMVDLSQWTPTIHVENINTLM